MPTNGGLLELGPDDYQDIDPSIFATDAVSVASPDTPRMPSLRPADGDGATATQGTDTTPLGPAPAPTDGGTPPAPEAPGFFERLQRGIGKVGWTLGGGDPGLANLSPEQQQAAGARALLNMGISMLARSGPTWEPRNFGEILAGGLAAAQEAPTREESIVGQQAMAAQEMGLKRAQLANQTMVAQARVLQLRAQLAQILGGQKAADDALRYLTGNRGGGGGNLTDTIIGAESGGDPSIKNPASEAQGPGQFIPGTWSDFVKSPANTGGWTEADRFAPAGADQATKDRVTAANRAAVQWYAQANGAAIQQKFGRPATDDELLAAHLLGPDGAMALIGDPNGNVRDTLAKLSPKTVDQIFAGNAKVLSPDMTNGQALAAITRFYRGGGGTATAAKPPAPAIQEGGPPPAPPGSTDTGPYAGGGVGAVLNPQAASAALPVPPIPPKEGIEVPGGQGLRLMPDGSMRDTRSLVPAPRADAGAPAGPITARIPGSYQTASLAFVPPPAVPSPVVPAAAPGPAPVPFATTTRPGDYNAPGPAATSPATPAPPAAPGTTAPVTAQPPPPVQAQPNDVAIQQAQQLIAAIQQQRDRNRADAAQRIATIKGQGGLNAGQQVSQVLADFNTEDAKLAAEIRAQQDKVNSENRAYNRDIAKQNLTHQQAIDLENLKNQNTLTQNREAMLNDTTKKRLEDLDGQAGKARENLASLDVIKALSDEAGGANVLANLTVHGQPITQWLQTLNIGTPEQRAQWTAQQALNAAVNKFSIDMRSGQGLGRLFGQELDYLSRALPGVGDDQPTRDAKIGLVTTINNYTKDYAQRVRRNVADGMKLGDAEDEAQTFLGNVLPRAPAGMTNAQAEQWLSHIPDHSFYHAPDGSLKVKGAKPRGASGG